MASPGDRFSEESSRILAAPLAFALLCLYGIGMATVQEARAILTQAQSDLNRLMERALKEQRFGEISAIAGYAEGLSTLLGGRSHSTNASDAAPPKGTQGRTILVRKRVPSKKYPRFVREGDKLVKIGWSKKAKAEYEHKAPREAVLAFSQHLLGTVKEGKVFAVEDVLPVPDIANGVELPAYQVYLVLAWLRSEDAVQKQGRDGYVIRPNRISTGSIESLFSKLDVRP